MVHYIYIKLGLRSWEVCCVCKICINWCSTAWHIPPKHKSSWRNVGSYISYNVPEQASNRPAAPDNPITVIWNAPENNIHCGGTAHSSLCSSSQRTHLSLTRRFVFWKPVIKFITNKNNRQQGLILRSPVLLADNIFRLYNLPVQHQKKPIRPLLVCETCSTKTNAQEGTTWLQQLWL